MATGLVERIEALIADFIDPYLGSDWVSAKAVKSISVDDAGVATIQLSLGYPAKSVLIKAQVELEPRILGLGEVNKVQFEIDWVVQSHQVQTGVAAIEGIKNCIAVASGKGGVGKSTTAVNLALALAHEGASVGLLDADIYGPNQPEMLGVNRAPESLDSKKMAPVVCHGLQTMSIGYLVDDKTPMVWRGPMVSSALQQLIRDTQWDDLDYLIIDLPPGTGDVQLTLAQKIPVSGSVVVTTPQDIALSDVRKAVSMFEKVHVPVLGIIENMSVHKCKQCGHEEAIFGSGGAASLAAQYNLELLGSLPLDTKIREFSDQGTPMVVMDPQSEVAKKYKTIALTVAGRLSMHAKNYASKFPNIVVETS